MVDLGIEPTLQSTKLSSPKIAVQITKVLASLFHKLGGVEIAKGIRGEVADASHAPVNVLKASHGIGGRRETEALREFLIPGTRNVGGFQIAADQGLLHLETQDDVHVVGGLIRLHADEGRLNIVDRKNKIVN